jgi:hypothetical protein
VKSASLAFVVLLILAHAAGDFDELLGTPLSMFRDTTEAWLGHAMFAALLLMCVCYTCDLIRAGHGEEAMTAGLASVLLFVVATTPSFSDIHLLSAFVLLLLLFVHYWQLLNEAGSVWLFAHIAVPIILIGVSGAHSYGLWQKCAILYLLALANLRHAMLSFAQPERVPVVTRETLRPQPMKRRRRKVRQVASADGWGPF